MKPSSGMVLLGGVVVLVLAGRTMAPLVPAVSEWVQGLGWLAPIAFVLIYAAAEVVLVPGSLLTLAAGALFGVGWGTLIAMAGATLGASAAFLVARYLMRRRVERWTARSPQYRALDAALATNGGKIVFLVRLTPLIPFNLLNYALGVTKVRFPDYLLGSLGMIPGTLLFAYYGQVAGDVARVASGVTPPHGAAYYGFMAVGLVATIGLTVVITRTARRALTASVSGLSV